MKIQSTSPFRDKWVADVKQTSPRVTGDLYYGKSFEKSFNVMNRGDYFVISIGSSGAKMRFPLKTNKR